jgi:glutamate-1-semialdehyde 2,1-aminomutase
MQVAADKLQKSRALLKEAQKSLVGGVSSPFRAKAPGPLYFADGCGCWLEDVDGNRYIDYALAWGPLMLGHRHPSVVEAIRRQAGRPHDYGAQHELEIQVSQAIQRLVPCAERVAYTSSGSEAAQLAMRLARGFTQRTKIVKFEGHYHGWMDSALISYHPSADQVGDPDHPNVVLPSAGQVPNSADNVLVAQWNQIETVEKLFRERSSEIAGVIMEPVLCNSGCLMPLPGYLAAVRDLCRAHGALLIFDEVITGFRISLGGAQGFFDVTPDLAMFGKALAAGITLSAVAGREEILKLISGGRVAFGGTFNGNPLSLAASDAALREYARDNGQPLRHANAMGEEFIQGLTQRARKRDLPLTISGFGAAFGLHFTRRKELTTYRDSFEDDVQLLEQFVLAALDNGLYVLPDGRIYVSAVHTEQDIEKSIAGADRAFAAL